MEYSKDLLLELYLKMLEIRLCEEGFVEPILKREIKTPVHLYTGEEAVAVGVCGNLTKEDKIFGTHRSHGHYLAKGGSLESIIAEVYCKATGCNKGRGGSMHLIDPENGMLGAAPIVGGTISLALGSALASSIRKDKTVTVAFFGDGASGEGVLWECVNFASIKKLPIIFVCENNLYSTHMPIDEIRANRNIYEAAKAFDIYSKQVDGNNVLDVYGMAKHAVNLCRNEEGPCFIEAKTYRLRGHVGPDDNIQGTHTDIRPKEEYEEWKMKDPVTTFRDFILDNTDVSVQCLIESESKIKEDVNSAFEFADSSKRPIGTEELMKYVYR